MQARKINVNAPTPPRTSIRKLFEEPVNSFQRQLPPALVVEWESIAFSDVEYTIRAIELGPKRWPQNIAKIKPFLDVLRQYNRIVDAALHDSKLFAFVWVC